MENKRLVINGYRQNTKHPRTHNRELRTDNQMDLTHTVKVFLDVTKPSNGQRRYLPKSRIAFHLDMDQNDFNY